MVLKKRGLLQPFMTTKTSGSASNYIDSEGYWKGFAARLRVIVYNTDLLKEDEVPDSIHDFVAPEWKGKLVIAYPLFGTTEIHFAGLRTLMGDKALEMFRAMLDNDVAVVDGNAQVVNLVARGEYAAGFTDTDDAWSAKQEGKPVGIIFPDQEGMGSMMIPNTVAMIKGCPNPDEAREIIEFLTGREVQDVLANSPSAQIPVADRVMFEESVFKDDSIKVMDVNYEEVAGVLEETRPVLKDIFAR
jgi:iron(III) transport system substrate-binding protein